MSIFSHDPARIIHRQQETAGCGVSDSDLAMAQRAELHLDLSDSSLAEAFAAFLFSAAIVTSAVNPPARRKKTGRPRRVDHEAVKALYLSMLTADGSCLSSRALAELAGCSQSTSCRIIREIHREAEAKAVSA